MKPFATLGSEISKVRDRVRRSAEALRPAKVASDVRDQRDRLLAKLGEQTFRLIAERKLQVPKVLQDSVDRLATLLGVQLPPMSSLPDADPEQAAADESLAASYPLDDPSDPGDVDEPSLSDVAEATPVPPKVTPASARPARTAKKPSKKAASAKKNTGVKKGSSKKRAKR